MHPSNIPLEDYIIVYIGRESLSLANLMLSYNRNTVRLLIHWQFIVYEVRSK